MAAKKKAAAKKSATKKKSSKKKVAKKAKPAAKKKTAKKSTRSPKKKTAKKSAARKSITRKKKAAPAKKQSPRKKATSVKKVVSKKKAAKPRAIPPPPPTPVTPVTRERARPRLREVPTITAVAMNIEARFELGVGHIIAKQFRAGNLIDEDRKDISDTIIFLDVRTNDVIAIDGVCAGTARITTDRNTIRPSDQAHPLEFDREDIFASLIVL